jgi:sulfoxide reductase heme-binding subunit YedZ
LSSQTRTQPEQQSLLSGIGALAGIILLGVLASTLTWAVLTHTSLVSLISRDIAAADPHTAWYISRSAGIVAYLLLSGSVAWGLILTTKIIKDLAPPPAVLAVHNAVSWVAIGLGILHAASLMFDTYYSYRIWDLLIPFTGPYRPGWVGLGTLSFYVMVLASVTFTWRNKIGMRIFRLIHYLTFPLYGIVTVHGLMAGTDSSGPAAKALYIVSLLFVLYLTNYRLLAASKQRRQRESEAG